MRLMNEKGGQLEPFMENENGTLFVFEIESECKGGEISGCLVVILLIKSADNLARLPPKSAPKFAEVFITVMYD